MTSAFSNWTNFAAQDIFLCFAQKDVFHSRLSNDVLTSDFWQSFTELKIIEDFAQ